MLCLCGLDSAAQKQGQEKIDSLLKVLNNYKAPCDESCIMDSVKVNLLNDLSNAYQYDESDSAVILGNEAFNLSKEINWQIGAGDSYYYIANAYFHKSNFNFAIDNYLNALNVWNQIENTNSVYKAVVVKIKKPSTLKNIAGAYRMQGNYLKALDYLFETLQLAEKSGNKDVVGAALGDIGLIYRANGEYDKAIEYYNRSLKILQNTGNNSLIALLLGNLGSLYYNRNDYNKALEYANKSLDLHQQLDQPSGVARQLGNIGNIHYDHKEYNKALEYYFKAIAIQEANNYKYELAINLGNIGLLYNDIKKYTDAEKYLKRALKLSEEIGDLEGVKENNSTLSNLSFNQGNYRKALEYYQKAIIAKDSLFNEERTAEITRKEMNYSFEKQQDSLKAVQDKKDTITQQEIAKQKIIRNSLIGSSAGLAFIGFLGFVNFRNKRKREKAELSQQVSATEMKALRSQMNPHFIFNALQSIQTFLVSNKSEDANTYLLKFSKLMRAVLENSQHGEVPIKDDKQALELYMQLESIRLKHPFTYQFHIDETVDIENDTIPPLILQPFVENAIWHGLQYKPEPGHINIYISKKDSALHAIVEDNGIGRNMSKQVAQPMLLKKESLGMKLTEERLKVLNEVKKTNAQFKIIDLFTKNNEPAGTKVELLLPLVA